MKAEAKKLLGQGLSQREVARRLGVSKTTIGIWFDPVKRERQIERTRQWQLKNWSRLRGYQRSRPQTKRPRVNHKRVTYFVLGIGTGLVKVGSTVCLPDRLKNLQCGSPARLKLIGLSNVDEAEFRYLFQPSRRHGEWYKDSKKLRNFILIHSTEI